MEPEAVDQIYGALEAGDLSRAQSMLEAAAAQTPDDPELWFAFAELAAAQDEDERAIAHLNKAVELDPDFADAHHALARYHELAGERAPMIAHDLKVLALDEAADKELGLGSSEELELLNGEAEWVLSQLPDPFRARLENVPVILEARPARWLVEEGFDPRAFGLFEGPQDQEHHSTMGSPLPSRVLIFYANLLSLCLDEDELREELKTTVLHEIGHYFGLDEDQLAELGLA